MYDTARYSTSPNMIKFACKNGITQNPMYMKCETCPNQSLCEIYFRNNPAPELSAREREMIRQDLENARQNKKAKLTLAEQWKEVRIGATIFVALCLIGYLLS